MYKPIRKKNFRRRPLVIKIQKHKRVEPKRIRPLDIWSTIRPSAFRAIGAPNSVVSITKADQLTKIPFPVVQFDLCGEYDPIHSVFIPKTSGVYSISSLIAVNPVNPVVNYVIALVILVNGIQSPNTPVDNDFFGTNVNRSNATSVSTILKLNGGDRVEIFATTTTPGFIDQFSFVVTTSFEAARFPSPC
ncbi:ABC transporter permease [Paenibacillus sp. IHBB 3054]|uniref:ABC transporter permease n=1 Tax=Paenibacillus sp. IHBB 3054 TaxID=3425689 RepID=UPI003F67229B